jgi:hypothetical protein
MPNDDRRAVSIERLTDDVRANALIEPDRRRRGVS